MELIQDSTPDTLDDSDKLSLIEQAAELLGKTCSEFMLETACREAIAVLRNQYVITLDAEAFEKFQAMLDAPPRENPRMRKLLETKALWET
jgi:uncharacterized protein (DUF1778 family)